MTSGKYELREITPKDCFGGLGCPAVFEVARVDCVFAACPAIYGTLEKPDTFFVVGKIVDPKETGLADKVGSDEQVIEVPKSLLEKLKK